MTTADDGQAVETDERTAPETVAGSTVTAHESSPERTVFTEHGNRDGWIATDTTVSLDR